jgi:chromosome segregation ATPase
MPKGTPSYDTLKATVDNLRASLRAVQAAHGEALSERVALKEEVRRSNGMEAHHAAEAERLGRELQNLSAKFASLQESYEGAMSKHEDDREVWRMRTVGLEDRLRRMEDEHSEMMAQERVTLTTVRKALLDAVAAASGRRNTN